jgi:5-formyltetrahydrofolate cyclo-ligase
VTEKAIDAADLAAKKAALRTRIRATRAKLGRALVRARSEQAAARLCETAEQLTRAASVDSTTRVIALFAAIEEEGELDPRVADPALRELGLTPVYPRVATRRPPRLSFHEVADPRTLSPGPLGVPTPALTAREVAVTDIDVFVIPGIAFTEAGARLGFGGGYYDATLAEAPRARRIGYTHPEQLVDDLPETNRDQRVDELVLPDRTLSCPPRPRDATKAGAPGARP